MMSVPEQRLVFTRPSQLRPARIFAGAVAQAVAELQETEGATVNPGDLHVFQ